MFTTSWHGVLETGRSAESHGQVRGLWPRLTSLGKLSPAGLWDAAVGKPPDRQPEEASGVPGGPSALTSVMAYFFPLKMTGPAAGSKCHVMQNYTFQMDSATFPPSSQFLLRPEAGCPDSHFAKVWVIWSQCPHVKGRYSSTASVCTPQWIEGSIAKLIRKSFLVPE